MRDLFVMRAKPVFVIILSVVLLYYYYYFIRLIARAIVYELPAKEYWYYLLSILANSLILCCGLFGLVANKRPVLQAFVMLASLNAIWLSIYGTKAAIDFENACLSKWADQMGLYSWDHSSSLFSRSYLVTLTWDTTQANNKCCGFKSRFDWNNVRPEGVPARVYPDSCCQGNTFWSHLDFFGNSTRVAGSECREGDEDLFKTSCDLTMSVLDLFMIVTAGVLMVLLAAWAWCMMKVAGELGQEGEEAPKEDEERLSGQLTNTRLINMD